MSDGACEGPPGHVDDHVDHVARARQQAREEIGDALHDGVVQSMTAVMMGLAVRRLDAPPGLESVLDEIELELSGAVAELRDLIRDLRAPSGGAAGTPQG